MGSFSPICGTHTESRRERGKQKAFPRGGFGKASERATIRHLLSARGYLARGRGGYPGLEKRLGLRCQQSALLESIADCRALTDSPYSCGTAPDFRETSGYRLPLGGLRIRADGRLSSSHVTASTIVKNHCSVKPTRLHRPRASAGTGPAEHTQAPGGQLLRQRVLEARNRFENALLTRCGGPFPRSRITRDRDDLL